jgi:CheY-like chemotaxis protein
MNNRKFKILAIDDIEDNLTSLKALITEAFPKATTYTASSGAMGIEIAEAEDPDVILLDILMPGMDGFQVCSKLKADRKLSDIPVVFVTALKYDKENRIRALDCGAEAFLSKPIDESELKAQIRAMVKIKDAILNKRNEKERLEDLVALRTIEYERELANHQKTERALIESDELFTLFLFHSPFYAYIKEVTSVKSTVLKASENFHEMIGIRGSEMVGKSMEELFPAEFAAKISAEDWEVVSNRKMILVNEDLHGRNYTTLKFPISQRGRNLLAGYTIDITDRKQSDEVIKEKTDDLERFNNLMVDRELKMIELKKEINQLLLKLGEKSKYKIANK